MKNLLILLLVITAAICCDKEEVLQGDEYFIFGIYNGYCSESCTTLFKVANEKLYADDVDRFFDQPELKFEEDPLSQEKYLAAKTAFDKLPSNLLDTSDRSFGCPGCVDQDIIYLSYFDGAELVEWQVDTEIDMLPEYLQDYAQDIQSLVATLVE